jgi:hypothetical protein
MGVLLPQKQVMLAEGKTSVRSIERQRERDPKFAAIFVIINGRWYADSDAYAEYCRNRAAGPQVRKAAVAPRRDPVEAANT